MAMTYTFGPWCVDSATRSISGGPGPVHLTRKAFELLLLLLECCPDAVSKDQIHARVWPDATVTESSLQVLMHEIRKAIDAPGSRESWIRTVHGVGYRFCGDVVVSDPSPRAGRRGYPAAWLVGESTRVALHAGENVLGRGTDVIEIEDATVSRRHARVVIAGDTVTVEDLGSKNGTWVEDERLTAARALEEGRVLKLGSASFTFRLARRPKSTERIAGPTRDPDRPPR